MILFASNLRTCAKRCNPDPRRGELDKFEYTIQAWGRGSAFVNLLIDEQCRKLGVEKATAFLDIFTVAFGYTEVYKTTKKRIRR